MHDVIEDYNVYYEELKKIFGVKTADATLIMSKVVDGYKLPNDLYYSNLGNSPIASLSKGFDRVHNLMTMIGGFSEEKRASYLKETLDLTIPMLKKSRRKYPEQEDIYENIKFVMINQILLHNSILINSVNSTIITG